MESVAQRILVVDDEEDLREILRFNLEAEGFEVETAASAEEALVAVNCQLSTVNLILLDVMMDKMSGFEMAEELRRHGDNTPIIFLTARDAHDDQLQGFGVGADDYITKPFSFDTVLARVKAVLRRSSQNALSNQNTLGNLTKREHLILQLFQEHPGQFFTREEILKAVWPDDTLVGERSVDVHIARLRKKMGTEGQRIVNKTGFGYGLV
ncbi:MAG: response regulator transcription factor [Bacteroidales bacterium]|nr:response regulator transcription factor [Bacteroidales bacterium]